MAEMKFAITFTLAAIMVVAATTTFAQQTGEQAYQMYRSGLQYNSRFESYVQGRVHGNAPSPWAKPSWDASVKSGAVQGYNAHGTDTRPKALATREEVNDMARAIAKTLIAENEAKKAEAVQSGQVPGSSRVHVPPPGGPSAGTEGTTPIVPGTVKPDEGNTKPGTDGITPAPGTTVPGAPGGTLDPDKSGTTPAPGVGIPGTTTPAPGTEGAQPDQGGVTPGQPGTTTPAPGTPGAPGIQGLPGLPGTAGTVDPEALKRAIDQYLENKFGTDGSKYAPVIVPAILKELADKGYKVPTPEEWKTLNGSVADHTTIADYVRRWWWVALLALILAIIALLLHFRRRAAVAAVDETARTAANTAADRAREASERAGSAETTAREARGVADDALGRANAAGRGAHLASEVLHLEEAVDLDGPAITADLRARWGQAGVRF